MADVCVGIVLGARCAEVGDAISCLRAASIPSTSQADYIELGRMSSANAVVCDCKYCLKEHPNGRQMSAVLRSRHRRNEATSAALELLAEAERAATTKLFSEAVPSLFSSSDREPRASIRVADIAQLDPVQQNERVATSLDISTAHSVTTKMMQNITEYNATLRNIALAVIREANSISRPETLQFLTYPVPEQKIHWESVHEELQIHSALAISHKHHFVLSESTDNREFVRSELILRESLGQIDDFISLLGQSRAGDMAAILDSAQKTRRVTVDALSQLITWKRAIWMDQASKSSPTPASSSAKTPSSVTVDPGRFLFANTRNHDHHPLVLSSTVHAVLSNLVYGMPTRGCETLLEGFRYHTQVAVDHSQGGLSPSLPGRIPRTLAGAFQHLDLNPTLRQYIVCPNCHSLCPAIQPYPLRCRNRPVPGEPGCQAALLTERRINGKICHSPVKTYLHQDFKMWLARLLSRPSIESIIRASQSLSPEDPDGKVDEILGSKAIRDFRGSDDKPFLRQVDGQYRLLFALSVDGFNPLTNKVAKQIRTSTGIYLICLNLPLALRQLPHNMYLVGVVPGPNKLKEGELNHYLDLVVDDFKPFWDAGVTYLSTSLSQRAILCFAAIVSVVCDALGAREVSGFPTITSSQFCIYCKLSLSNIENFDSKAWPKRKCEEHRILAEEWKTAKLADRVNMQKDSHPARYSSLLRLPYFDPVNFTLIDTMHLLYLGMFERHCRNVWGMNVKLEDGDGTKRGLGAIPLPPSQEDMEVGRLILLSGAPEDFHRRGIKKDVLYYLCNENGLRTGGKKRDLINELRDFMAIPDGPNVQACPTLYGADSEGGDGRSPPPLPVKESLSLSTVQPITAKLQEQFPMAEGRLAKNLSLQKYHNETLRVMCFLRDLRFETQKPVKRDMMAALASWRAQQVSIDRWVPTMHISQLETLAARQGTHDRTDGDSVSGRPPAVVAPAHEGRQRSHRPKPSPSAVLGGGVMKEYVIDRRNMVLPPWILAPPAKAGHASHGKMSADQWRVFCSVNLPVTLIRIWGTRETEPRWREMLFNFLDLVLAVEIASLVITTDSLIVQYERYMHRYLETLKSLYKDAPIAQNQHIAMHVGDVMRAFGPTSGYRAFGTERFNYKLQRVKTNRHEFGEIEMTMTRSVCRASNLISLLENPHALPKGLQASVSGALKSDERGTRVNDVPSRSQSAAMSVPQYTNPTKIQSRLTDATLKALLTYLNRDEIKFVAHSQVSKRPLQTYIYPDVTFLRVMCIGGSSYRSSWRSLGSSHVLVKVRGGSHRPAQIQVMFRHTRECVEGKVEEEFIAVRFFQPLNHADAKMDPYRMVNRHYKDGPFQDAFGTLWADELEEDMTVLQPRDIVCHFGRTAMRIESISVSCFHVQALTRLKTQFEINSWMREDLESDVDIQGSDDAASDSSHN